MADQLAGLALVGGLFHLDKAEVLKLLATRLRKEDLHEENWRF